MKKITIIIIIMLLMLNFGCVKTENGQSGTTSGETYKYSGGKEGLLVSFQKDMSSIISVGEEMDIILEIENRGVKNLAQGDVKARLKGDVNREIFNPRNVEASNGEELLAAKLDESRATIYLGPITYTGELHKDIESTIEAEVCFPYTTLMQSNKFFVSDKKSDVDKGKIEPKDNFDAPVHISDLQDMRISGDKLKFSFIIENVGKGKIVDSCFSEQEEVEKVTIDISQPRVISCETLGGGSSGTVELTSKGRQKIECQIGITEGESSNPPLIIELEYHYDVEKEKTITIQP